MVKPTGETVWECGAAELPEQRISGYQIATRLPNGNTLVNNWLNSWSSTIDPANAPAQALELTPEKKVVWTLGAWSAPNIRGPANTIQLLATPSVPEADHFGEYH